MSHYIEKWCRFHGEWDCDSDSPDDECEQCIKEGKAPSQLLCRLKLEASGAAALLESDLESGYGGDTRREVARSIREIIAALEKP